MKRVELSARFNLGFCHFFCQKPEPTPHRIPVFHDGSLDEVRLNRLKHPYNLSSLRVATVFLNHLKNYI